MLFVVAGVARLRNAAANVRIVANPATEILHDALKGQPFVQPRANQREFHERWCRPGSRNRASHAPTSRDPGGVAAGIAGGGDCLVVDKPRAAMLLVKLAESSPGLDDWLPPWGVCETHG